MGGSAEGTAEGFYLPPLSTWLMGYRGIRSEMMSRIQFHSAPQSAPFSPQDQGRLRASEEPVVKDLAQPVD